MGGGGRSSPPGSVREIGTYTAYSEKKDSAGVNGVQMEAGAPTVHTYTEARNTCTPPTPLPPPPPPCTSFTTTFSSRVYTSRHCFPHTSVTFSLSGFPPLALFFFFSSTVSFTVPPELNGEPSRNNKY